MVNSPIIDRIAVGQKCVHRKVGKREALLGAFPLEREASKIDALVTSDAPVQSSQSMLRQCDSVRRQRDSNQTGMYLTTQFSLSFIYNRGEQFAVKSGSVGTMMR